MSRRLFFPGCAITSYNPEYALKTTEYLKEVFPELSVVQKCCGAPTKFMGLKNLYEEHVAGIVKDIKDCEADEVIVGCQSCVKVLVDCGGFKTTSLWEMFPKIGLPKELVGKAKDSNVVFSVHDSCSVREYKGIHEGIRWIIDELGYQRIDPPGRSHEKARCCGLGGMVHAADYDLALEVMKRRVGDFPTPKIVAYCAMCRLAMLAGGGQAWHILDLIWGPVIFNNTPYPIDTLSDDNKFWENRAESKKIVLNLYGK